MSEPQVDLTGARILAVDDVPENLDVLLHTLEEIGYEVLVANDGETALKIAADAQPDLILLDVMMPGIDGYETCRRLKAIPLIEETPVIYLTARDDIEGGVEGFEAGGVDYIVKPFRKEEVLVRIRTHLERARFAQALAELNAHLEEKVVERTRQLQLKVRELEGRDRIARHMLTFHSLEEALQLVLEVIAEIVELDRAVIFLEADDELKAAAGMGLCETGKVATPEQLGEIDVDSEHQRVLDEVRQHGRPQNIETGSAPFAIVPILGDRALLGLIAVDKKEGAPPVSEDELRTLESFALEAAGAINDAQIRRDPRTWEDQLDEILDLDEEIDDAEIFDQLNDKTDR